MFESKKVTGDYHSEMYQQTFEEWFASVLLKRIPPHSIIVMDNAPYHSRRKEPIPVKSWTKSKMIEWLSSKGLTYPVGAVKNDVWEIVDKNRPRVPTYVVDEIAYQEGKVLT